MEDARNALGKAYAFASYKFQNPLPSPLQRITEAVEHVSNYVKADPVIYHNTSYFVEGWGWDHTKWPAEQWPTTVGSVSDPRETVN